MDTGHFYYITDQYYVDFPDAQLMRNKESINGQPHGRPSFFAFKDESTGLYWMIPISSQVLKYRHYYDVKVKKYGICDTIAFGRVLGYEKAFLLQNMCPVSAKYIKDEYMDARNHIPVRVNGDFEKKLLAKAKRVLALQRKGVSLIFPDVVTIESALIAQAKLGN